MNPIKAMSGAVLPIVAVAASAVLGIVAAWAVPSREGSVAVAPSATEPLYGYLGDDGFIHQYGPDGKEEKVAIVITDVLGNANVFTLPDHNFLGKLPELVERGYIVAN